MRLDPHPLFRRVIAPWYDSTFSCWVLLFFMVVIALFSWAGISVALDNPAYRVHLWLPVALLIGSLFVTLSILRRLIRRYYDQHVQTKEP